MSPASLTSQFVSELLERNARVDDALVLAAARSLFDFAACVRSAPDLSRAWPVGRCERLAVAAHAQDRDDIHWPSLTHPGGLIWPIAVIEGCARVASPAQIVRAVALGYDATVGLALALGPSHRRYWQATCTAGTIGAALTYGTLIDLPRTQMVHAAAHAISVAGGSIRALVERSGTRLLHRAHAVSAGIACARAAASGLPGTVVGLEAPEGLFAAAAPSAAADIVLRSLSAPALTEAGPRLYATSGFGQSAVDAAIGLGPIDPGDIARLAARVSPAACLAAGVSRPANREQAWNSIPYAVACCLGSGSPASLEGHFELTPEIARLLEVTTLEAHEGPGAELMVELRDGRRRAVRVSAPTGDVEHPAQDEQLVAKWDRMLGSGGAETLDKLKRELLTRSWYETVRLVVNKRGGVASAPMSMVGEVPPADCSGGGSGSVKLARW